MEYKYNDYELLYLISEGTIEAEDILYNKYSFLIKKRIRTFRIQSRYQDDFYQEGLMCLNTAINTFCDFYNKSFNKFFDLILQRRFIRLLKKDQDYFYGVVLVEDNTLLSLHLEEDENYNYEIDTKEKIDEYKDSLKNANVSISKKIEVLIKKGLKPKQVAIMLDCDIKKVYNQIYALKNKGSL